MPINIGTKPSGHAEAAADVQEQQTFEFKGDSDEGKQVHHEYTATPVAMPPNYEEVEVGVSFRMPVAQYTMLEFTVRRSMPYNPVETDADEVFETVKTWVEGKLNGIIAEQQNQTE